MEYGNLYPTGYAGAEMERTCSVTNPDSIASDLSGPGRAVDNAVGYLGRHLERLLGKVAVKIGHGPSGPANGSETPGEPQEIGPTCISRPENAHSTQSVRPEATHTCSITDPDSTVSNLTGPGRAVDNFYLYAGRHLELLLSKVAMKMGKGPLITAKRILHRRADMMSMTMTHSDNCYCHCHDCDFQRKFGAGSGNVPVRSPAKLRKIYAELNKDSRRLVNYVKSEQFTTQTQALNSVIDLSACDGELRAILKASGASKAVSDVVNIYENFRFSNRNIQEVLLNTSRKALVSLDDTVLNTLLKEFFDLVIRDSDRAYSIWNQIIPYLWSPHHAFLVVRMVRKSTYWLSPKKGIPGPLIAIKDSPGYFEWEECEEFITYGLWMDVLQYSLSNVSDWLFQNMHRMPRVLEAEYLNLLSKDVFQLSESQFIRFHSVQRVISQALRQGHDGSLVMLQNKYSYQPLSPLLNYITCPVTSAAGEIILRRNYRNFPDAEERRLAEELVCYIDATDSIVQTRAWNYIEYFLAHDVYRCNMIIDTLSRTAFGSSDGFSSFTETKKKSCIPNRNKDDDSNLYLRQDDDHAIYFRHCDSANITQYHDRFGCNCLADKRSDMEMLRIFQGWIFDVMVERGEAFSSSTYYPFPAGIDEDGTMTYLVTVLVAPFRCRDIEWSFQSPIYSVNDGTRPEDLRIEVQCSHRKFLLIPTYFMVSVLRYSPEACAEVMGVEARTLFTTGPYSWKPRKLDQDVEDPDEYQSRILTIEDAVESGYSQEQIQYDAEKDEPRCDDEDWPNSNVDADSVHGRSQHDDCSTSCHEHNSVQEESME